MTTITIKRAILDRLIDAWDSTVLPKSRDGMMQERMEDLRAALAAPATAPEQCWCDEQGIGEPGVSCGDCPTRDYKSPATAPEQPSWQDAPTEPGMWACLYMGELSTSIFNAYEIEHFDRDEMVGCRWRFIPEDKQ